MTKEELEHNHIKKISENYVNESWGPFADLSGVDLVMAGIGVAKIISKEKEKRIADLEESLKKLQKSTFNMIDEKNNRIAELEKACEETQELLDKQIEATYRLDKENAELKNRDCWKSCEYANPKAELIGQHIKDVQNLTKAKELLKKWLQTSKASSCDNINIVTDTEQFLKECK